MAIEFHCPSCQQLFRTPDQSAGKKGKCPHCGSVFAIPAAAGPSTSAPLASPAPRLRLAPKLPTRSNSPARNAAAPYARRRRWLARKGSAPRAAPCSRSRLPNRRLRRDQQRDNHRQAAQPHPGLRRARRLCRREPPRERRPSRFGRLRPHREPPQRDPPSSPALVAARRCECRRDRAARRANALLAARFLKSPPNSDPRGGDRRCASGAGGRIDAAGRSRTNAAGRLVRTAGWPEDWRKPALASGLTPLDDPFASLNIPANPFADPLAGGSLRRAAWRRIRTSRRASWGLAKRHAAAEISAM